jgi:hypothetical protein
MPPPLKPATPLCIAGRNLWRSLFSEIQILCHLYIHPHSTTPNTLSDRLHFSQNPCSWAWNKLSSHRQAMKVKWLDSVPSAYDCPNMLRCQIFNFCVKSFPKERMCSIVRRNRVTILKWQTLCGIDELTQSGVALVPGRMLLIYLAKIIISSNIWILLWLS